MLPRMEPDSSKQNAPCATVPTCRQNAYGQKLNVRDLHSAEVQKQSDAELPQMIAQGKGKMPAFSKTLSADQIKLLVAHIRELGKK